MASPDKSSMASNLLQTHSAAPTHWNFTEVLKVPFFISQRPSGACLFNVVCDAARGLREPIASCGTIRETQTLFSLFFHFGFFVDWKEILKHCAMVPQKFWKVVRVWPAERVRAGRLEKRSPCCILSEWSPTWLHLWVLFNLSFSKLSYKKDLLSEKRERVGLFFWFFVARPGWKLLSQLRGWRNHSLFQLKPLQLNSLKAADNLLESFIPNRNMKMKLLKTYGVSQQKKAHSHEMCQKTREKLLFLEDKCSGVFSDPSWMHLQSKLCLFSSTFSTRRKCTTLRSTGTRFQNITTPTR